MKRNYPTSPATGLQKAALIVVIISIVFNIVWAFIGPSIYKAYSPSIYHQMRGFWNTPFYYFLSSLFLVYAIPMTLHYYETIRKGIDRIGCGFIFCTFLFFSPIAAILMLIDR